MISAPLPHDEAARLKRLRELAVLDTEAEPLFDSFARIASRLCGTPIALVSLIDQKRQWFKSRIGLEVSETHRDVAFCSHAIHSDTLMEVPDALMDARFDDNPLVTGNPGVRFYAGAPIVMPGGARVGTLCVIDRRPRTLDVMQRELLGELSRAVAQALLMRESTLDSAWQARSRLEIELGETARALATSEHKFRVLSESSPVGVFQTDAAGLCTYTNGRWQEIFGLNPEQGLGHGWAQTLHAEDREKVFGTWSRAARGGEEFAMDFRIFRPDGSIRHVRSSGRPVRRDGGAVAGYVGAVVDVTEQRRAQDALNQSRQSLRALYESTPAMLHSIDAQGRLLTVTDTWLRTLGYKRKAVIGRSALEFFAKPSRQRVVAEVMPALFGGGTVDKVALQMLCSDGQLRDVLLSAVLDRDAQGAPQRALVFIDDVTEDLARRAELQREQALRQQIERHAADLNQLLAERSEMLDVLAHEVRQPLNNASAALQSAAAALQGKGEEAATTRLGRARSVVGQVLAGIDNTLATASLLAGAGQLERQDTDIDMLIGVTIADMPHDQRARIAVLRETATRTAAMDMGLVRLALRNLLANALKYSPAHSIVQLRVADSDDPLALVLEVSDRGGGFEAELGPRLFERGAKGSCGGHGLGLYIARRVMDLHRGRIELVRNSAQGSTLRLVIEQSAD